LNLLFLTYRPFLSPFSWVGKGGDQAVILPLAPLLFLGIAIIMVMLFFGFYLLTMSRHIRHLNNTLIATQLALAKEQKISAFGTLAAAAAHELGSPLSTISLAAKEIVSSLSANSPLMEDAQLIVSQGDRCRNILVELSRSIKEDPDQPQQSLPLSKLIERAAQPHKPPHITLTITKEAPDPEPHFYVTPDLLHGLGNVLQNAFQFATSTVRVTLRWDKDNIEAIIKDDGKGYPPAILSNLGNPQPSKREDETRKGKYVGLGLGLFIAKTLLSQRQGHVHFSNDEGAQCLIKWPRSIQAMDPEKKD
jgi:two-component system sensor histidine kinase RegB